MVSRDLLANQKNIDSLKLLIKTLEKNNADYTIISEKQFALSRELRNVSTIEDINLLNKIYEEAQKRNNINNMTRAYYTMGNIYSNLNMWKQALEYCTKNLELKYNIGWQDSTGYELIAIGNIYYGMKIYENASVFFEKAKSTFSKVENNYGLALANNNLGLVCKRLNKLDSAIFYFNKGLVLRKIKNNPYEVAHSYVNIAEILIMKEKFAEADSILKDAMYLIKTFDNKFDRVLECEVLTLQGDLLFQSENFTEAQKLYKEAINSGKNTSSNPVLIYNAYDRLILTQKKVKNNVELLSTLNNGLEYAKDKGYLTGVKTMYMNLWEMYENSSNLIKANYYAKKYKEVSDSIDYRENQAKWNDINIILNEFENKQELEKNQKLALENIYKANNQRNIFILLGSFLLIVTIGLVFQYIRTNKFNLQLINKNNEIEVQKDQLAIENEERKKIELELRNSEHSLQISNSTKDKFFSIIAHDLRNPIMSINRMLEILIRNFDKYSKQELLEFISETKNSSSSVHDLLESLLTWSRSQTGRIIIDNEIIDLDSLIFEVISQVGNQAFKKDIQIKNKIENGISVWGDYNMLNTILRNFITNAIKFSHRNSEIIIGTKIFKEENTDFVEIYVQDFGIGMSTKIQKELFKIDGNSYNIGTENEKGSGLGIIICKEFIDKHNSKLLVKSQEGIGTCFSFALLKK